MGGRCQGGAIFGLGGAKTYQMGAKSYRGAPILASWEGGSGNGILFGLTDIV